VINPGTVVDEEDDTVPASTPDVVAVAVVSGSAILDHPHDHSQLY
jgi:hypothetical protein